MNESFFSSGAPASGPGANLPIHHTPGRRPALRCRKRFAPVWIAIFFALLVDRAPAQTNVARPSGNRWLLVVENSRAMQRRGDGLLRIAGALVLSGMNGQMQRGDTLGLWTYNEDVHAGQFQLQTWAPEARQAISGRVVAFLRQQKYEKNGRVEKVIPALDPVLRNSDLLTVVLISAAEEPIRGTPFDDEINRSYDAWRKEQERARMPFLTFLRGERGRLTAQWVNAPPWPLEMRPLPAEAREVPPPKAPAPPTPGPLIFSGRNPVPSTQEVFRPIPATTTITNTGVAPETDSLPAIPTASVSGTSSVVEIKPDTSAVPPATPETLASKETPAAKSNSPVEVSPALVAAVEHAAAPESAPSPQPVAVESAIGTSREDFLQRWAMWIAALLSGFILFLLGIVWSRRSRGRFHVSLMTREKE